MTLGIIVLLALSTLSSNFLLNLATKSSDEGNRDNKMIKFTIADFSIKPGSILGTYNREDSG